MADVDNASGAERGAYIGLIVLGLAGAVVGLIRGLSYPPTAWFAVIEGGLPSAIVGALLGGTVGYVAQVIRRRRAAHPSSGASPWHKV